MANVKLRIEINSDASNEALGQISTNNMEFANTSIQPNADGVFSAFPKLSNATSGINALTYGQELCFNDSDVLDNIDGFGAGLDDEENPVEVVWGIVNEDKTYNVTLTFTGATGLQNVIVYGDKESQQFPTRAILDGTKEVFSDDYAWTIEFDEPSDTHTIQFTHWNRANYNAVLTLIDIMLQNYEVDIYNGLKSIESLSQSSANTTGIFYGSIESSGSAEILDKNGELGDLLTDGIIDNSNVPIKVLVNGKEIQHHISTDSAYNRNSKTLSIELGNRLNTLDVLKYKGYAYPDHPENLANLLFDVLSNLRYALFGKYIPLEEKEFKEMLSARYDSTMTLYDYLYSIQVEYPVIEANKTYREVIDEFCLIAQMQMYIDDNNNVRFVTARPKEFNEDFTAIHIPKKNMFSQLDYSVILKNKYDGVEASKNIVQDIIDYATILTRVDFKLNSLNELTTKKYIDSNYNYLGLNSSLTYLEVNAMYYSGSVEFDKKQNQNLEQILVVFDTILKDNTYTYQNNYTKYTTSASGIGNPSSSAPSVMGLGVSVNNIVIDESSKEYEYNQSSTLNTDDSITYYYNGVDSISKLEGKNESKITNVIDDGDKYKIDFIVLCGKSVLKLEGGQTTSSGTTDASNVSMSGTYEMYEPIYGENTTAGNISFYGNKRTISFEQVQSNTPNIELAKTKVSIGSSNLIQDNYIIENIKTNIIEDYKQGISNASVSISCNDYFDSNGRKVIDWSNGELPEVNQIVYFDNDIYKDQTQRYWKIKSRNFRKTGVPMVDLELEECKTDSTGKLAGMYNEEGFTSWNDLIKNNYIVVSDDNIINETKNLNGEIIMPNTIKGINNSSFSFSRINKITLSKNLQYIAYGAFMSSLLSEIIIPKNVVFIGEWVFRSCDNLISVVFEDTNYWRENNAPYIGDLDVTNPNLNAENLRVWSGGWALGIEKVI